MGLCDEIKRMFFEPDLEIASSKEMLKFNENSEEDLKPTLTLFSGLEIELKTLVRERKKKEEQIQKKKSDMRNWAQSLEERDGFWPHSANLVQNWNKSEI